MKSNLWALLVVGLLSVPMAAYATPITNGGFETGDLTGWSCVGADLCAATGGAQRTGSFSLQGFDNIGFATLSQSTGTTIGATYAFSFWSFDTVSSAGNILRYQVDGGSIVTVGPTSAYAQTSTLFTATAASTVISFFFETDDGTGTWLIDDVSVEPTEAAVPEPASLALLGLGLAGLVARRLKGQR